jgi:hypothetical protein
MLFFMGGNLLVGTLGVVLSGAGQTYTISVFIGADPLFLVFIPWDL